MEGRQKQRGAGGREAGEDRAQAERHGARAEQTKRSREKGGQGGGQGGETKGEAGWGTSCQQAGRQQARPVLSQLSSRRVSPGARSTSAYSCIADGPPRGPPRTLPRPRTFREPPPAASWKWRVTCSAARVGAAKRGVKAGKLGC